MNIVASMFSARCRPTFLLLLAMIYATKARTPGLKSKVLTLINQSSGAGLYTTRTRTTLRCAQECLRLGNDVCKYAMIDETNRKCEFSEEEIQIDGPTFSTDVILVYEVTAWEGVFLKVSRDANYEEASDECCQLKGSLASYEHLMSAVKYGEIVTCDPCWLISGEVTFTNDETMCELVDPAIRCNIYPNRTVLYPCFYCHVNSNKLPEERDYHSVCNLLHLKHDGDTGYIYTEAESRCQNEFGGHLALPIEVYNASLNGVQTCESNAWFSHGMQGIPYDYEDEEICWANVLNGFKFSLYEHHDGEGKRSAYCSLANWGTDEYPFPAHGIVKNRGRAHVTLNFSEASDRCNDIGGTLATYDQMVVANEAGYQATNRAWIQNMNVVYSCVFYPDDCSPYGVSNLGQKDPSKAYDAFCHVPKWT